MTRLLIIHNINIKYNILRRIYRLAPIIEDDWKLQNREKFNWTLTPYSLRVYSWLPLAVRAAQRTSIELTLNKEHFDTLLFKLSFPNAMSAFIAWPFTDQPSLQLHGVRCTWWFREEFRWTLFRLYGHFKNSFLFSTYYNLVSNIVSYM